METLYEFADESVWPDARLQLRAKQLGQHIVHLTPGSARHDNLSRETNHVIFELTSRSVFSQIPLEPSISHAQA